MRLPRTDRDEVAETPKSYEPARGFVDGERIGADRPGRDPGGTVGEGRNDEPPDEL